MNSMVITRYIRSAVCMLFFMGFGIGGLLIGVIAFPLIRTFSSKNKIRNRMLGLVRYAWKFFVYMAGIFRLFKVDARNIKDVMNVEGAVIVCNHPSLIDIVILMSYLKNSTCIVKGTLANSFFIKHIVRAVFLSNDFDVTKLISKSKALLKKGYNVVIFPEGTRSNATSHLSLYRIFAQIALKTPAPIYMVKITQSFPLLGKSQAWYKIGDKTCVYTLSSKGVIHPSEEQGNYRQKSKEYVKIVQERLFS